MASYRVAVTEEHHRPLSGVTVEAVSLNDWPDVAATAITGDNGTVEFTKLSGPHWFRSRALRVSTTLGDRTFSGEVNTQIVSSGGEGVNVDYVVDSNGMGTHTALFGASGALEAALTAGSRQTIWICSTHTEPALTVAHALGTQTLDKIVTIWGAPEHRSLLPVDATSTTSMFTYHKDTNCTIIFKNIRFDRSSSGSFDIFSEIVGGSGIPNLAMTFKQVEFNNVRAIENTTLIGLAQGDKNLKHCSGSLVNVIRSTAAGGYGGTVVIEDCYMSWTGRLNQLGNYEGSWAQAFRVRGGKHTVTSTEWFVWGNTIDGRFYNLTISFIATTGILFAQGPNLGDKYVGDGAIFQNIDVLTNRSDNRLIYFPQFLGRRNDPLVIDGFHGEYSVAIGTAVPMIEIATQNAPFNTYIGLISRRGSAWTTAYKGPGDAHLPSDVTFTTNDTPKTIATIPIPEKSTLLIEARVVLVEITTTNGPAVAGAAYVIRAAYRNNGGTVALIGSVVAEYTAEDDAAWDATLVISGTNVIVQITGAGTDKLTWHCTTRVQAVGKYSTGST